MYRADPMVAEPGLHCAIASNSVRRKLVGLLTGRVIRRQPFPPRAGAHPAVPAPDRDYAGFAHRRGDAAPPVGALRHIQSSLFGVEIAQLEPGSGILRLQAGQLQIIPFRHVPAPGCVGLPRAFRDEIRIWRRRELAPTTPPDRLASATQGFQAGRCALHGWRNRPKPCSRPRPTKSGMVFGRTSPANGVLGTIFVERAARSQVLLEILASQNSMSHRLLPLILSLSLSASLASAGAQSILLPDMGDPRGSISAPTTNSKWVCKSCGSFARGAVLDDVQLNEYPIPWVRAS